MKIVEHVCWLVAGLQIGRLIIIMMILKIAIHLQQMQKIGPFRKSQKGFWHIQNWLKGSLERKRTSLQTKTQ
jgi:hypothetical protein